MNGTDSEHRERLKSGWSEEVRSEWSLKGQERFGEKRSLGRASSWGKQHLLIGENETGHLMSVGGQPAWRRGQDG